MVRLMERGQRTERLERRQDCVVDLRRCGKKGAAMDDAMPDGKRRTAAKRRRHAADQIVEENLVIRFGVLRPAFLGNGRALCVLGEEVRRHADALDLPLEEERWFPIIHCGVARELDARRSRIDDENGAFHAPYSAARAAGAAWRRACARRTATAADAIRVRRLSARLVKMIGIRAPSTMPAASALDM